jgi:flagellar hook assembly protein FlgD
MFNYPNPFTTTTCFRFEHNQACSDLNVQIKIFSITGKLVKTINKTISTSGFIAESVSWDGKNDFGSKVSKGIYIYKLQVNLNTGEHAEATGKLIILK